jgi:structural maintenance of chromosome 1
MLKVRVGSSPGSLALFDLVGNSPRCAERQRKSSQHNVALSEESLQEYRRLKANASMLAVDERQSLETLTRDEKTSSRTLAAIRERHEGMETKREKLIDDARGATARKTEVGFKSDYWE